MLPHISDKEEEEREENTSSNTELCTKNDSGESTAKEGPEVFLHGSPECFHLSKLVIRDLK